MNQEQIYCKYCGRKIQKNQDNPTKDTAIYEAGIRDYLCRECYLIRIGHD